MKMTLRLDQLTVLTPNGQPLFQPVNVSVAGGDILSIVGASGIGKSTLLDAIGGHLKPEFRAQGHVDLNGTDLLALPAERREVGLVFQDALLFPHLSVGDNIAFGLPSRIKGAKARRAAVNAALGQAGLDGFYARDPATLSGGQRARAALMRCLIAEPKAVLLDEPFSKLDPVLRIDIRDFTCAHIRAAQIPALLVTHDLDDATAAGGHIVELTP